MQGYAGHCLARHGEARQGGESPTTGETMTIIIKNMYFQKLAIINNEPISWGGKLSGFQEHQMLHKIAKLYMEIGINAEFSTDVDPTDRNMEEEQR